MGFGLPSSARAAAGIVSGVWLLCSAFSCGDERGAPQTYPSATVPAQTVSTGSSATSSTPQSANAVPHNLPPVQTTHDSFDMFVFSVALNKVNVTILDVNMSSDFSSVLQSSLSSLVINGGFFEVDTEPEGLAVSGGRELSPKSLVLGGGVLTIAEDSAKLFAVEEYTPPAKLSFAVQCRPRLVVDKQQHVKKDDGRRAERTALCIRDSGKQLDAVLMRGSARGTGPTLSEEAALLTQHGCEYALNLDGGPSTGAAWMADGQVRSLRPREGVRHAIAFAFR